MRGEVAKVITVLPHGVGAEAMEEDECRTGRGWLFVVSFRGPAMHDGASSEVGRDGAKAGCGEGVSV